MYDDDNLCVAFVCEEPNIGQLTTSEVARDGALWRMDIIELFLGPKSPTCSGRYYHFAAAPAPNAFYDDRTGFKTADDKDPGWNAPGFRYGFHVDKAKELWSIEMVVPFKDIAYLCAETGRCVAGKLRASARGGR